MENVTTEVVQRVKTLLGEAQDKHPIQFYLEIQDQVGGGIKLLQLFIIEEGLRQGISEEKIAEVAAKHAQTLWIVGISKLFAE